MEDKHKYFIMVVEDEKLLLEAITRKLELEGDEFSAFMSGREAFSALEKAARLPDLIWLDYYLGDMDGKEFMTKLKSIPRLTNIPVMVVSNSASEDKVSEMIELGVIVYLLKADYRLEEITKLMRKAIKERKQ